MRYFKCKINTTSKSIKENSKIKLQEYDYENAIAATNAYIYENIVNNLKFFIFREEQNFLNAMFCFHEEKIELQKSIENILNNLENVSSTFKELHNLEEITTDEFVDNLIEATRNRSINRYSIKFLEPSNEFLYDKKRTNCKTDIDIKFSLEERIVSDIDVSKRYIYNKTLIEELDSIEKQENTSGNFPILAHYIISSKSKEANLDMVNTLANSLYNAGRLTTKRIEILSDLSWEAFKSEYIEYIIQDNKGGVIAIDLREKFANNPIDYDNTCEFIKNLVKKYRNQCQFIFMYNPDNPGFSLMLLRKIQKLLGLVQIKEAKLSKENSLKYLRDLIRNSSFSQYENMANEYMKEYKLEELYQSEVMEEYERFETWCINKNNINSYKFNYDADVYIEQSENEYSHSEKLKSLIGLDKVKDEINKLILNDIVEKQRKMVAGKKYETSSRHMIFAGNPGTAKTTIARLFSGIGKEEGILKSGAFIERSANEYSVMGGSNLENDFKAAKGGVLFIDEAYSLSGNQLITALLAEMENKRDDVIVILAGYTERMEEFLNRNEGLKSRIPNWIEFQDYTSDDLIKIFELMSKERGFKMDKSMESKLKLIFDKARLLDNFGNGRYARNLLEATIKNQSIRLKKGYDDVKKIPENELFLLKAEDVIDNKVQIKEIRKNGDAKKELESMIGLEAAKNVINKAVATFKIKNMFASKGINQNRPAMHMVFTGNPGTAKTTVARLVSEILRDEKILPSGKFMEVGRADLVGTYLGETAVKVKKRFKDARGGVLFIDEAYSLYDGYNHGFGDEAINTIVQEMENHREDTVVIFAGYPNEMKKFLDKNPGMKSRIAFNVEFEDYTTDELVKITNLMLKKKNLRVTKKALDKLRKLYDASRKSSDFGNGRFVRKVIEEAEMNLYQRISLFEEKNINDKMLTTIEDEDIIVLKTTDDNKAISIGFRAS